jgi:hypothetical protein
MNPQDPNNPYGQYPQGNPQYPQQHAYPQQQGYPQPQAQPPPAAKKSGGGLRILGIVLLVAALPCLGYAGIRYSEAMPIEENRGEG